MEELTKDTTANPISAETTPEADALQETASEVQENNGEEEDIQVRIENKINEIRDEIGSRINNVFITANKISSNVRQALDLEVDPGLLEPPDFGDIICVHRIGFEHYGVYVGDDKAMILIRQTIIRSVSIRRQWKNS